MSDTSGKIRWFDALWAGLTAGLVIPVLILLPSVYFLLPRSLQDLWFELVAVTLGLAFLAARACLRSREWRDARAAAMRRLSDRLDLGSAWMLDRGLCLLLGLSVVAMLVSWIPHYLTWPWCRDEDTFAVIAQSWDAGIRPYRDIRAYNFPGHIYLHWLIGKGVGWGHPRVIYALDAALVAGLVAALPAWSRRRLGRVLPGLVAAFVFLGFYLGLDFELVAERDWHATLAAALALMVLEAWPGRRALWIAAALQAAALTIRPHAVLFVPAMLLALLERPRARRAILEWSLAVGCLTALGFLPLVLHGILDDLIRGLRVASYGGPYSKATPEVVAGAVRQQFTQPWILLQLPCLVLLCLGGGDLRRPARTWLLALLAAILYRALHPHPHSYLRIPPSVVSSITIALPVAWLVSIIRLSGAARVLILALLLVEAVPGIPLFCQPRTSLRALPALFDGVELNEPPPGCRYLWFRPTTCPYEWPDYCKALDYLRRETTPDTEIANVLRRPPFPPFNGTVGRLSPFRAESGICWMWLIDLDLDEEFAEALERTPNSVVVWSTAEIGKEPRLKLERVNEVIRRRYRPEVQFGPIEIWRRLPEDDRRAASGPAVRRPRNPGSHSMQWEPEDPGSPRYDPVREIPIPRDTRTGLTSSDDSERR